MLPFSSRFLFVTVFITFCAHVVPFGQGSPFCLTSVFVTLPQSVRIASVSGSSRTFPAPLISLRHLLLVGNGFKDRDLGASCAHYYRVCRPPQWKELGGYL